MLYINLIIISFKVWEGILNIRHIMRDMKQLDNATIVNESKNNL